jgi:hypothetical protein
VFTFSSNFGRLPFFIKAFYSPCAAAVALDNIYISGQACAASVVAAASVARPMHAARRRHAWFGVSSRVQCGRLLEGAVAAGAPLQVRSMCDVDDDLLQEKTNKCDVNWELGRSVAVVDMFIGIII